MGGERANRSATAAPMSFPRLASRRQHNGQRADAPSKLALLSLSHARRSSLIHVLWDSKTLDDSLHIPVVFTKYTVKHAYAFYFTMGVRMGVWGGGGMQSLRLKRNYLGAKGQVYQSALPTLRGDYAMMRTGTNITTPPPNHSGGWKGWGVEGRDGLPCSPAQTRAAGIGPLIETERGSCFHVSRHTIRTERRGEQPAQPENRARKEKKVARRLSRNGGLQCQQIRERHAIPG
ncbi:hypothetical protein PR048_026079 [Dryococelus australis]|uniref:Uncharacterized protein n=1 Tax=Dryococelus australis TaxID=614101 RepID=A0ABQ9GKC6_9NEOP|nr:hypothetical protein PR048_026079 [Dryococelus australis]